MCTCSCCCDLGVGFPVQIVRERVVKRLVRHQHVKDAQTRQFVHLPPRELILVSCLCPDRCCLCNNQEPSHDQSCSNGRSWCKQPLQNIYLKHQDNCEGPKGISHSCKTGRAQNLCCSVTRCLSLFLLLSTCWPLTVSVLVLPCGDASTDLAAIAERMSSIKNKLLVLSGKGGVGKSTFATQLAFELAAQGNEVGQCGPLFIMWWMPCLAGGRCVQLLPHVVDCLLHSFSI